MSDKLFQVNYEKAQNIYAVKNDKTSIDKFIIKVKKELGDKILDISVRGLIGGLNDFNFKQLPHGFVQKALYWESNKIDRKNTRQYYIKLYIDWDKLPLAICNMSWTSGADSSLEPGTEAEFYYNRDKAFNFISPVFKKYTKYFMVSTFCGILPMSSWYARAYIKVIIELPVTGYDVFTHACIDNLSEFGLNQINEIRREFTDIVANEIDDITELYIKKSKRLSISRRAENNVRKKHGLKNVGDMFINETMLANYVKTLFPDTIRQFNTKWLRKYLIDIYIPSLNLAIEYHGEQHYKAISRFGGEEKFLKQRERDNFVREQCKIHKVLLLEWHHEQKVTEKNVYEFLSKHIDIPKYKRPSNLFND